VIGGFVRDLILNRDFKKRYRHIAAAGGIKLALKFLNTSKTTKSTKTYGTAMLRFEDT
jgi:tRNA nucleotidyltransferase (CCA-adding enzyme)